MKNPLEDYTRNAADLRKIPLFNPRFREVYGVGGTIAIITLAMAILTVGVVWLAPWNSGYTAPERKNIWFGIFVMPFAGLLTASYVVEFCLKAIHIGIWAASGMLDLALQSKILGGVAGSLLALGCLLSALGGDLDLWGYLALFIGIFVLYWFVSLAWEAADQARRPNQAAQTTPGLRPSVSDL
jgi:hypothetical protein